MTAPVLEVRGLRTCFRRGAQSAAAVDGVSFTVREAETLALVGESGCGKTVTALSVLRLIEPPGCIEAGEVWLGGRDLLRLTPRQMRTVRGGEVAMVFQDPLGALNPVMRVGAQIAEAVQAHGRWTRRAAAARARELLARVGIPAPAERAAAYPHQLSGGLRQRVLIAMALAAEPRLLIADEPTTALDATSQTQIVRLLDELRREAGLAVLLITHDLGLVAELADQVAVMYAGRIVEEARVEALFDEPRHPYTAGLFASQPRLAAPGTRLAAIPGEVPSIFAWPAGCRFRPRCPLAVERCSAVDPVLAAAGPGRHSACLRLEGGRLPAVPAAGAEGSAA
jgi:oligopeptide/dipeptide ABC transporter ATP-binding protein